MNPDQLLLVLDTETTGLDPARHQVIEVAAALFDGRSRTLIQAFSAVLHAAENPARDVNRIPDDVLNLEFVRRCDLSPLVQMFHAARWIVAHNKKFDRPMVDKIAVAHSLGLPYRPWVCSASELRFPKSRASRNLGHLAVDHDFPVVGAHRALADVMILCRLLERVDDLGPQLEDALRPRKLYAACLRYDERQIAKDRGFSFFADAKQWRKRLTEEEVVALPFSVVAVHSE